MYIRQNPGGIAIIYTNTERDLMNGMKMYRTPPEKTRGIRNDDYFLSDVNTFDPSSLPSEL
jgi:hypothetical protein